MHNMRFGLAIVLLAVASSCESSAILEEPSNGGSGGQSASGQAAGGQAAGGQASGGGPGSGPATSARFAQAIDGAMLASRSVYAEIPIQIALDGHADSVTLESGEQSIEAADPDNDGTWTATLSISGNSDETLALAASARVGRETLSAEAELVIVANGQQMSDFPVTGFVGTPRMHRIDEQLWLSFTDRQDGVAKAWLQRIDGAGRSIGDRISLVSTVEETLYARAAIAEGRVGVLYQQSGSPYANFFTVVSLDGTEIVETDDAGYHDMSRDPLIVQMSGSELVVTNNRAEIHIPGSPDMRIEGGVDVPLSATSVHHHFGVAWDWLKTRRPSHPWLEHTVRATVELREGSCNAYYTSGTINFLVEDPERCHNLGQIADVTYHELGHGVHHYILESGTFAGDISEGSADFISATILDDPVLAPNARLDGSFIRELDTDKRYPEDAVGEVHTDGLIWGSFLWNLREQWQAESGEAGIEQTDLLFLDALAYGDD